MGLSDIGNKIAIFIIAVLCTVAIGYAVVIGMHWVFVYIGGFSISQLSPSFRLGGAIFIGVVVVLRVYLRRRAKLHGKQTD
ncbi:MAG TPA: hypothetical protein VNW52_06840 [Burkholderiaceae bacterium]|nr:hypothetical protein [Burkholderiaceae bacterium]